MPTDFRLFTKKIYITESRFIGFTKYYIKEEHLGDKRFSNGLTVVMRAYSKKTTGMLLYSYHVPLYITGRNA